MNTCASFIFDDFFWCSIRKLFFCSCCCCCLNWLLSSWYFCTSDFYFAYFAVLFLSIYFILGNISATNAALCWSNVERPSRRKKPICFIFAIRYIFLRCCCRRRCIVGIALLFFSSAVHWYFVFSSLFFCSTWICYSANWNTCRNGMFLIFLVVLCALVGHVSVSCIGIGYVVVVDDFDYATTWTCNIFISSKSQKPLKMLQNHNTLDWIFHQDVKTYSLWL